MATITLQQFFDSYHLSPDGEDIYERRDYAECFVCDAQEHPHITASLTQIESFANKAFRL